MAYHYTPKRIDAASDEQQYLLETVITHPIILCKKRLSIGSQRRMPWVVCCYAAPRDLLNVPRSHYGRSFDLKPNKWVCGKRTWRLIKIKRFASLIKASESKSLNRNYHPFNDPNGIVVLMHCTRVRDYITEYQLGRSYPNG